MFLTEGITHFAFGSVRDNWNVSKLFRLPVKLGGAQRLQPYITRFVFPSMQSKCWVTTGDVKEQSFYGGTAGKVDMYAHISMSGVCEPTCYCSTAQQTLPSRAGNYMGSTPPPPSPRPPNHEPTVCLSFWFTAKLWNIHTQADRPRQTHPIIYSSHIHYRFYIAQKSHRICHFSHSHKKDICPETAFVTGSF